MSVDNLGGKAIFKIAEMNQMGKHDSWCEVIIKNQGEVIYHNRSFAGIFCAVQSCTSFTKKQIVGDSQAFVWGPKPFIAFAWDQFNLKSKGVMEMCFGFLANMVKQKPAKFKETRRRVLQHIKKYENQKYTRVSC